MKITYGVIFTIVTSILASCSQRRTTNRPKIVYHYLFIDIYRYEGILKHHMSTIRYDMTIKKFYNTVILDNFHLHKKINIPDGPFSKEAGSYNKFVDRFTTQFGEVIKYCYFDTSAADKLKFDKIVDNNLARFRKDADEHVDSILKSKPKYHFLEFRMHLQSMMFETIKEIFRDEVKFLDLLDNNYRGMKQSSLKDCHYKPVASEDRHYLFYFALLDEHQDRKQRLLSNLVHVNPDILTNHYNHCILDLTPICLEDIASIINRIKSKEDFEQRKKIASYQKKVLKTIKESITFSLEAIKEMKKCVNQRFTIIFDIFLILGYAAMLDCPDKTYKYISASLKEILNDTTTIVCNLRSKHGRFTVEVLGINDLGKNKLYGHVNTSIIFAKIEKHIERNKAADQEKLAKLTKLIKREQPSRWCFDGFLFDSLIGFDNDTSLCTDINALKEFYECNVKLVIDTCLKCKGTNGKLCETCEYLTNSFLHLCLLSWYYRNVLEQRTKLYYYQNMDDLVKFGKQDEEKLLEHQIIETTTNIVSSNTEPNLNENAAAESNGSHAFGGANIVSQPVAAVNAEQGFEFADTGVFLARKNPINRRPRKRKQKKINIC